MTHDPTDDLSATLLSAAGLGSMLTEPQARAALHMLTTSPDADFAIELVQSLPGCTFPFVLDELARRMRQDPDPRMRRACAFALLHAPRPEHAATALAVAPPGPTPPPHLLQRLRSAGARFLGRVTRGLEEFAARTDEELQTVAAAHRALLRSLTRPGRGAEPTLPEATFGVPPRRGRTRAGEFTLRVPVYPSAFPGQPAEADHLWVTVRKPKYEPAGDAAPRCTGTVLVEPPDAARVAPAWLVVQLDGKDVTVLVLTADAAQGCTTSTPGSDPIELEFDETTGLPPIAGAIGIEPDAIRMELYTSRTTG